MLNSLHLDGLHFITVLITFFRLLFDGNSNSIGSYYIPPPDALVFGSYDEYRPPQIKYGSEYIQLGRGGGGKD